MDLLRDKDGSVIAFQYKNCIIEPATFRVLGVVLGHCIFNGNGDICGKYFNHIARYIDGHILAIEEVADSDDYPEPDSKKIIIEGWNVISKITDHSCPSVDELDSWSDQSLVDVLTTGVLKA